MHTSNLAVSASAQSDGTTLMVSPSTLVIGGTTNANAFLRFSLATVPIQETFVQLQLQLSVQSVGAGSPPSVDAVASEFGAAIALSTYGLAEGAYIGSHKFGNGTLRDYLQTFLVGTVAQAGQSCAFNIPSQYVQETLTPVSLTISAATNATPIVATTATAHNLADHDMVNISGGLVNTAINGIGYVKVTGYSGTTFALYSDPGLTIPIAGNGTYTANSASFNMQYYGNLDIELRPHTYVAGATNTVVFWGSAGTTPPTLAYTTLTDWELMQENTYRGPGVAGETFTYFGIEATKGVPVKGLYALDMTASTLDSNIGTIASRANRRQRAMPYKVGLGGAMAGGNVSFELTPHICWQLLRGGMVYAPSYNALATNVLGADGNIYPNVYTTGFVLGTNTNYQTFTFIDSKGDYETHVYNGCVLDTLSISCQLGSSIDATVDIMAREIWPYDVLAAGGSYEYLNDPGLSYDTNVQLVYVGSQITQNGIINPGTIQNVDFTLNNNAHPRNGLRRNRTIRNHYLDKATATVTFTMEFENEVQFRRYFAALHKQAPYRVEFDVLFDALQLDFMGALGSAVQNISIRLTQFQTTAIAMPTGNSGIITMRCTGVAKYDPVTGTNLAILITSPENHPVVYRTTNASQNPITVFPLDRQGGI